MNMPPNNPMTEGEARAVSVETLRKAADVMRYAGNGNKAKLFDGAAETIRSLQGEIILLKLEMERITAHTAASGGEVVAWLAADDTGRVIDAKAKAAGSRASATGSATAIYNIPLYTTPPFAVPADALERLVEEMRRESTDDHPMQHRGITTVHADIRRWADELAALIPKGADHEQR